MNNQDTNMETINHPEGIEVKLSSKAISIKTILCFLIILIIGSFLFAYVWDEFSSYSVGYQFGKILRSFKNPYVLLLFVFILTSYILLQAGILYWCVGKNKKILRWGCSWKGVGFYLAHPIALKYYRVSLLLPGIILGLLPIIHGFCTGDVVVFFAGMLGIVSAVADICLWQKLRPFDEEDLILVNKSLIDLTIIKRNYNRSY